MSKWFFPPAVGAWIVLTSLSQAATRKLTLNPYDSVNWGEVVQNKANLHTHTVSSGGKLLLSQVVEEYARHGYTILAITDHNLCTKWQKAGIDPMTTYGILPVMGQEYSKGHHINGYFTDHADGTGNPDLTLLGITGQGGFAVINHPGRYWKPNTEGLVPDETQAEYLHLLDVNPFVLGIEVINKNNRCPHDAHLWDALLDKAMPSRPVWGFANDDMHERKQIGHSWEVFLLDRLDESTVRHAMLKGHFYFSSRKSGHDHNGLSAPPVIVSVGHDFVSKTITLTAAADGAILSAEHYRWIVGGRTVMTGPTLNYNATRGISNYVRAEIESTGGITYTNPFGFSNVD
ncbi:MAG TPA: hypothetical protein PLT74_03395 [Kiritimatiellia bacterium]|nr:hypothetical protein [Kiritimatiellia bacterium]